MSYAVKEVADRGAMQANYMWKFKIPNAPSGVSNTDKVEFQARSTSIPGITNNKISYKFMNGQIHYPGPVDRAGTFTLTVLVAEDRLVYNALRAWVNLAGDEKTGKAIKRPELVKTAFCELKSVDGTKTKDVIYHSFWPEAIGELALDYEGGEHLTCELTFSFDYQEHKA